MAIEPGEDWEVGRELSADELEPMQVVVIQLPNRNLDVTVWVKHVEDTLVVFYAGEINLHFLGFRLLDGSMVDDRGRLLHVFEYLGEV